MRTYVSSKYYAVVIWISFVISIILIVGGCVLLGLSLLFRLYAFSLFLLIPIAMGLLGLYQAVIVRTIFIEHNKIVAKGIFKTDVFDVTDFKEVSCEWWGMGGNFWIYFKDGSNFKFYPKWIGFNIAFTNRGTVDRINAQINEMK